MREDAATNPRFAAEALEDTAHRRARRRHTSHTVARDDAEARKIGFGAGEAAGMPASGRRVLHPAYPGLDYPAIALAD